MLRCFSRTARCLPNTSGRSWRVPPLRCAGWWSRRRPSRELDTTALDDVVELDDELAQKGISLVFAEMKGPIKDRLIRFSVSSRFGPDHFFPTVHNAVRSYRREFGLP